MPSNIMPGHSLTMWDATSSELTLNLMTAVAAVMVPVILLTHLGLTTRCSVALMINSSRKTKTHCTKESELCGILHGF